MVTLKDIESLGYKKVGKTQKSRVGQGTPPELVPEEVKAKLKALKGKTKTVKMDDGSWWKAITGYDGYVSHLHYWNTAITTYKKGMIELHCCVYENQEFISTIVAICNRKRDLIKCGENATIEQVEKRIEKFGKCTADSFEFVYKI